MKKNRRYLRSSIAAMAAMLLFVLNARANEPFHVKWTMDYTQAGASDHVNFTPVPAVLAGGPNTFTLPTVYSGGGGANVVGYIIRPWPTAFATSRYMEFTFTAGALKYNITSISFRLRRSNNGPNSIKVRTSMDGFAADLNAFTIANSGTFNTYSIPVSYNNLSCNPFTVRIYAYNSVDIYGTLWFDEIAVNGDVVAIILPVSLTYLKGYAVQESIALEWETAWEKNSAAFRIEKSGDMKTFSAIGTVPASGETTGRTVYTFIDPDPAPGNHYYRLIMLDKDGTFTTSKVISVFNGIVSSSIRPAPNPASPECIKLLVPDGTITALYNASGHPIPYRQEHGPGGNVSLVPATPLREGIYFILYVVNGRKEQLKVLVR